MLTRLTLTGADDATSISRMRDLSERFPFVEFGILYHSTKSGTGRYPSLAWITALLHSQGAYKGTPMPLALHLCGEAANYSFELGEPVAGILLPLSDHFPRVQMNINCCEGEFTARNVEAACARHPKIQVITQHNQNNIDLWRQVTAENHSILFDASRGTGALPTYWPAPLPGKKCSYAGGLGPETLKDAILAIRRVTGDRDYGVDMESRLRVKERFSLELCEKVAEIVKTMIESDATDVRAFSEFG